MRGPLLDTQWKGYDHKTAERYAAELQSWDEDGWGYIVRRMSDRLSCIEVTDEKGNVVGYFNG